MTIDDKIRDEKLQYDVNREVAKVSALSLSKLDKYECLTRKEIIPLPHRSKKRDRTSKDYLFLFRKSLRKIKQNDWRSRKNKQKQLKSIEKN